MRIFIKRNHDDGTATVGTLTTQEDQPGARVTPYPTLTLRTLEDTHHDDKVAGETRIKAGKYMLNMRLGGAMTLKYKRRFPSIHRGMLWLRAVPNFNYVYIHIGNTHMDTAGCILVGNASVKGVKGVHILTNSRLAYIALVEKINKALDSGEEIWVTIEDETVQPSRMKTPVDQERLDIVELSTFDKIAVLKTRLNIHLDRIEAVEKRLNAHQDRIEKLENLTEII